MASAEEIGRGLPRWLEAPLALAGLVAVSPLLVLAALAIKLGSPGPALFRQRRVGYGGCPFTLFKLRTMRQDTAPSVEVVTAAGDARITPVGRFLRRFKLDELPALWNVVRGEMSLVGPRPEVPRYVDLDDPRWRAALAARPGLTDPTTLRLRDEEALMARAGDDPTARDAFYRRRLLPFKLEGYAAYLARRTPWRDLGVILATLLAIVRPSRTPPPTPQELEKSGAVAPVGRRQ